MNPLALELDGIAFAHGRQVVLREITLQLAPGDFVALVGPNGAGKSTLLKCCAGVLTASAGRIRVAGYDLRGDALAARRALGLAVEPHALPPLLTGRECLLLFSRARGLQNVPADVQQLAEQWKLLPMLDRRVSQYSLGTRQKVGILLALVGEPSVLLLDEPLNGLDPATAFALKTELKRRASLGACIVLATHALEVAERFVNRAVLLVDGEIRRQWTHTELAALRADADASLEQAMAEAMAG